MKIDFPFWFLYFLFDIKLWFLSVPAAFALIFAGWYGGAWLGPIRWLAFALAAFLALPFPVTGIFLLWDESRSAAAMAEVTQTLDQDETIAGMLLPAGSKILFWDNTHSQVASIELGRPANLWGMDLSGTLVWNDGERWAAELTKNQAAGGWPCRAGPIEFDSKGVIQSCELAEPHRLLGFALPAGTHVSRGGTGKAWSFWLPPDEGLALPLLAATAPGGVTLFVADDGRLEMINSGNGRTIAVRGVPLNSMNFYIRGDKAVAALAEDFIADGALLSKETGVEIDLKTGHVTRASKNWWLAE